MARNQVSLSTIGRMSEVLEMAKKVFPDATSEGELFRRVIEGWYIDRQAGGKSGKLDGIAKELLAIRVEISMLRACVEVLLQNDQDRGRHVESRDTTNQQNIPSPQGGGDCASGPSQNRETAFDAHP